MKGGIDSEHPLAGVELRALRKLKAKARTPFVFETERGGPMTTSATTPITIISENPMSNMVRSPRLARRFTPCSFP